jgi:hypothetical protein
MLHTLRLTIGTPQQVPRPVLDYPRARFTVDAVSAIRVQLGGSRTVFGRSSRHGSRRPLFLRIRPGSKPVGNEPSRVTRPLYPYNRSAAAPVAQWIERVASDHQVAGSNPAGRAITRSTSTVSDIATAKPRR